MFIVFITSCRVCRNYVCKYKYIKTYINLLVVEEYNLNFVFDRLEILIILIIYCNIILSLFYQCSVYNVFILNYNKILNHNIISSIYRPLSDHIAHIVETLSCCLLINNNW